MLEWLLTGASLFGNYLNCRKLRVCFLLWIAVNIGWTILDAKRGAFSRAVLDVVQIGFSVYGFREWEDD